jgi:uncharacterized protein
MWEIYVPEARRRWGYYVLPILYGDRFAGRIEPRYERNTHTLRIIGISFEGRPGAMEDPRFLPALADAVEAYRTFVGADRLIWPRSQPGREVGSAIWRLG